MDKFTIYCQIGFLKHFFNQKPNKEDDFLSEDYNYWFLLGKLLYKHSNLIFDISKSEFLDLQRNPLLKRLLKSSLEGGSELKFKPEEFDQIKKDEGYLKDKIHEIFMLDKSDKECTDLENKYGLIFISKENIKKAQFLFDFSIIPMDKVKQKYRNWDFIKKIKHPFNAMVIADNYVLKDKDQFDNNILALLQSFMPNRLENQIFQLTILVEENAIPNIEGRHKLLSRKLKELFDYEIELTILRASKTKLHDRNIITNYAWINSGYGFSLFNNNQIKQDTHLSFYPITYLQQKHIGYNEQIETEEKLNNVLEIYSFLQKQFSRINDKTINLGITKYVEGSKQNRLLN